MATVCHYTAAGREHAHEIPDGARTLELLFTADWGDNDIRDTHGKPLTFCSFQCLADWATARAEQHDGRVLREGT